MVAHPALLLAAPFFPLLQASADGPPVDFGRDVRPLLARKCFVCHGNDEGTRAADLRLDVREEAVRLRGKFAALVPGMPDESELWLRITDDVDPMPPPKAGERLTADELDVLRRWIEAGAPYAQHWAFVAPERPTLPAVPDPAWVRTPVDHFVAARLAREGLAPSPEADAATLLRRVSLDLTGLPPSVEDVRKFVQADARGERDAAYTGAVERLLDSPHYGERWAAMWLDLARYADSAGHGSDPLRMVYRYRDWVIDAFDRNMPLDEFSKLQLAGDLVEEPSVDTQLATAFHRNTMTNTEGGTDDEEFRVLAVKDRVNTTGQVWLGLSVGCAECHSHKYDPLSQREYYALFDFFNHTADSDKDDERPRIPTPTLAQEAELARLDAALAAVDAELAAFQPDLAAGAERLRNLEATWGSALFVPRHLPVGFEAKPGRGLDFEWAEVPHETRVDTATHGGIVRGDEPFVPSALRVRAFASPELPGGGPGLSPNNGNFVLTGLELRHETPGRGTSRHLVRRIRLQLAGAAQILSLAEVEVLDHQRRNFAANGVARQSSTAFGGEATRAIDGVTSGTFDDGSVSHTATEETPWWELEFTENVVPSTIRVWNRTDADLERRLEGLVVVLYDASGTEVWRSAPMPIPQPSVELVFGGPQPSHPITLRPLSASFEQAGYTLANALDGEPRSGWAIGPRQGEDHEAVFELGPLVDFQFDPDVLRVTLRQEYGERHTLGRYVVEFTDQSPPPRALNAATRRAIGRTWSDWDEADRGALRDHLLIDEPGIVELRNRRAALVKEREDLEVASTPVMVELQGDRRRATHVLHKGNFLEPGDRVTADTPAALHPFGAHERDRLGLAEWLFDARNPLTARVTVNRLWARLFGRGLVATEDDFGAQGAPPTHPELLDWLAVELRESGWDQKALLRKVVLSSTYRQASTVTGELAQRDPGGVLLARYPRQRLEAEMVRDTQLAAAGLLSPEKFGPSVFPPQPAGLWQAAFNGERAWTESMGDDRWRRGLYVFMRRTTPYPMLQTFDAPSREVCTLKRPRTNTPLQAFVTLNDPVFVEAAQALGRLAAAAARANGDLAGVEHTLERATQRAPEFAQVAELLGLLRDARAEFAADEAGALTFATAPLGPLPEGLAAVDAAAWTLVASTALNLDAALTKE